MARGKQEVQTVAPEILEVAPLAEELAKEVRLGLETKTRPLLNHKEPTNMALKSDRRSPQILWSVSCSSGVPRAICPVAGQSRSCAQVVAVVPKTMEVEQTNLRERVIVVGQASEAEWQEAVKSLSDAPQSNLPWAIDGEVVGE